MLLGGRRYVEKIWLESPRCSFQLPNDLQKFPIHSFQFIVSNSWFPTHTFQITCLSFRIIVSEFAVIVSKSAVIVSKSRGGPNRTVTIAFKRARVKKVCLGVLLDPSGSLMLNFLTEEGSENDSGSHENDGLGTSSSDDEEDQEEHQAQRGQHT